MAEEPGKAPQGLDIKSTPEGLAKATILSTLMENNGKDFAFTKDKIDVVFPADIDEFMEQEEDWVLDQMEKTGIEEIPEDDLQSVFEQCMKTYVFEAIRRLYPNGFERKLDDETIDEVVNKYNNFDWSELDGEQED